MTWSAILSGLINRFDLNYIKLFSFVAGVSYFIIKYWINIRGFNELEIILFSSCIVALPVCEIYFWIKQKRISCEKNKDKESKLEEIKNNVKNLNRSEKEVLQRHIKDNTIHGLWLYDLNDPAVLGLAKKEIFEFQTPPLETPRLTDTTKSGSRLYHASINPLLHEFIIKHYLKIKDDLKESW